uniref:Uncharacterized protein n=1 Tax=Arundo donax TaxID=35708 RepID=A0A0A9B966_ARUDO
MYNYLMSISCTHIAGLPLPCTWLLTMSEQMLFP